MTSSQTTHDAVLSEVAGMLRAILDDEDVEVTDESSFHDDLELESVDLVTLAGDLRARYGAQVNLAEFLASKELDDIIALKVGEIVDFVTASLAAGEA